MTLSLYYFSNSTQWKFSKKSRRSWALKQGISIYANKGMGMNNSSKHSGCHAVYVRSRKYAHYFLNYFSRQFLETLYNFPPMLIEDRIDSRLFQLTHCDSRRRHVPDADGTKWSHKTNKYLLFPFGVIQDVPFKRRYECQEASRLACDVINQLAIKRDN